MASKAAKLKAKRTSRGRPCKVDIARTQEGRISRRDAAGAVFPPRDEWDIAAYDNDDVVAGFLEYNTDEPTPGPNRTPGYRWGWTNRRRDITHEPDGFEPLRYAYIRMARRPN